MTYTLLFIYDLEFKKDLKHIEYNSATYDYKIKCSV